MGDSSGQSAFLLAFTRRGFLRRAGISAAAIAAAWLGLFGLPAPLAYTQAACHFCPGPCSACFSSVPNCCSPDLFYCASGGACVCNIWEEQGQFCEPPCMFNWANVCDDGSTTSGCTPCC